MKNWLLNKYLNLKLKAVEFVNDEKGETNVIAIILIIVAVIAVVGIFSSSLQSIVTDFMAKIREMLGL